ncbi:MAG: asparagine synthase (glutamine-hydrolyzing), partial [Anaerolineales bacterium]
MCGICGSVATHPSKRIEGTTLRRMCHLIRHRGPDDEGYYLDDLAGLGMRRLSIIDLESGHQPITNENDKIWLVFNGEIYNFQEMRALLEKQGHLFKTRSDTEVIVHAYEEYGDRCVEKLNGMFAFALWDTTQNRLLLARDHLGIKPLYYWMGSNEIVFGSELKTVVAHPRVPKEIDPSSLDMFLSLEYIPSPKTIFKNIYKLPAGHRLVFQDGSCYLDQYWEISFHSELPNDEIQCAEMLDELIRDAVRHQMISDVPLGAFLSGGIDSSSIVAVMSEISPEPIKTFSIGFEDSTYNELPYARQVALRFGTDHYEETLQPDIAETAEKLMRYLDEPFADFSVFPTYLVSRVARQTVKVVLSGDGGDELFGGYDAYVAQNLDRYYQRLPTTVRRRVLPALLSRVPPQPAKKGLINKAKRFVEGANLSPSLQHTRWMIFM